MHLACITGNRSHGPPPDVPHHPGSPLRLRCARRHPPDVNHLHRRSCGRRSCGRRRGLAGGGFADPALAGGGFADPALAGGGFADPALAGGGFADPALAGGGFAGGGLRVGGLARRELGRRWLARVRSGWAGPRWVLDGRRVELEPIQGFDDLRKASPAKPVQLPILEPGDHRLVDPGEAFELSLRQGQAETSTFDDPPDQLETPSYLAVRRPHIDVPTHARDGSPRCFIGTYLRQAMQARCIGKGEPCSAIARGRRGRRRGGRPGGRQLMQARCIGKGEPYSAIARGRRGAGPSRRSTDSVVASNP